MDLLSKLLADWHTQTTARRRLERPYPWQRRTRRVIQALFAAAMAIMIAAAAGTGALVVDALCGVLLVLAILMFSFGRLAHERTPDDIRELKTAPLALTFITAGIVGLCVAAVTGTWHFLVPAALPLCCGVWWTISFFRSSLERVRRRPGPDH